MRDDARPSAIGESFLTVDGDVMMTKSIQLFLRKIVMTWQTF